MLLQKRQAQAGLRGASRATRLIGEALDIGLSIAKPRAWPSGAVVYFALDTTHTKQ